jgi:hypothetical protein
VAIPTSMQDLLTRIDAATTAVGTEIQTLRGQITTGMSDADVQAVDAKLGNLADQLEALGKDPNVPPPAPPTP